MATIAADVRTFRSAPQAWIRAVRVRQWSKNALVLAAPAAAGALGRGHVLVSTLGAFVVFCLLSSGIYLINDACDAEDDRRHPVKCHRPVASGAISESAAFTGAIACLIVALALAATVSLPLVAVGAGYIVLNVAYTLWLRLIAIADIGAIAGCFVLRAVAGGVAAPIGVSHWFILVVSFAALFVAAGKRYADLVDPAARRSRVVLEQYTPEFLRIVLAVACAVSLGAYSLWAFQTHANAVLARELTLVPYTLALLRYGLLVSEGAGAAPEAVLFRDRFLQLSGAAWVLLFLIGA
jgi:decaprenyl-phosphate phosphoribosyltransferase